MSSKTTQIELVYDSGSKKMSDVTSSDEMSGSKEAEIHRQVMMRKKKQSAKKEQPWKDSYVPDPRDIPVVISPIEKPWTNRESSDEGYDTHGGLM